VTGTPPPPIVWRRNEADLSALNEDEVRVFSDGSLYLTRIQLIHAGNYTCHAQRNKDVVQTHVLTVHSKSHFTTYYGTMGTLYPVFVWHFMLLNGLYFSVCCPNI
jgi:hypothetical protein